MAAVADDFDEVHLPVDITVESYDTLLLLMSSKEPGVLMPTISALREQIKDESIVSACIPRLVELCRTSKNDQVLTVVSWYLSALAVSACTEKWSFDLLSKSGAVSHVVSFAKQFDNPSISERCFDALVSLSADIVTSREIISHGALDVFKEALKRDDSGIQTQVSLALYRMSSDFENRRAILSSGLLDSLIEFLANEDLDEEVLGNALQATGNILNDGDCVVHFEERQGWNSVFPYLEDSDKSIQTYAYSIISRISTVPSFQYHFDDELLGKFLSALTDLEEFDPVVVYLLTIFKLCSRIPIVTRGLTQHVPLLFDRIFSPHTDSDNKVIIAEIFARLSEDANTHSILLEPDQLSRVCKLLSPEITDSEGKVISNPYSIRKPAIKVLDAVCENRSIRSKLHEYGAVDQLLSILHETVSDSGDDGWRVELQMLILPMLSKMIGDSKVQDLLIQKSIGDLEHLIQSQYPDVLNTSLLILATLAVDDGARNDIAERPTFLQVLISLVSNKKVAIRRNSLHAINSLAMHPKITIQLCNFGLIEKLRKFAASSAMINLNLSAFATNTLETLCANNVVAKFWVKDVLDFSDILEDGFYSIDPRADSYKSIEDLLQDVIHLRIEALLLDQNVDDGLKKLVSDLEDSFTVAVEQVESAQPKKKSGKKVETSVEPQTTVVIPEWPHIAVSVAQFVIGRMGGCFDNGRIPYEAEVSRCKYKTHSDVVMLGQLQVGTIRHRALLFKYLAQLYGMQVSITRNREDLSCIVVVRRGGDLYNVSLTGVGEVLSSVSSP